MMEKKRTRAWRRHQVRRVYKARLKYVAAIRIDEHVTWKDLLGEHGTLVYKTTGPRAAAGSVKVSPMIEPKPAKSVEE